MAGNEDDTDGIVIKIPRSMLDKHSDRNNETPKTKRDHDFYHKTNIRSISVDRFSEHGATQVQSIDFIKEDQRGKVLELLDGPNLYKRLPNLFEYIYQLGCENSLEKRHFAAISVSELSAKQPFLDLKEAIILPWALDENPEVHYSVATALSHFIKQKQNKQEVLTLLKHWVSLDNPMLINSAILTFHLIASLQPDEALGAIGTILKTGSIIHYQQIDDLFGVVYSYFPSLAIKQLCNWLVPVSDSELCWMSGVLFLCWVELGDTIEDEENRKQVVEIVFTLWDNPKMPLHEEMQKQTTNIIERWASETIEKMNKESSSFPKLHQDFFHQLYRKYDGKKKNRLDFYLHLWDKNRIRSRERERIRESHKERNSASKAEGKYSFLDLIPLI
nr:hypothetical protein [Desulfobacula sp.]